MVAVRWELLFTLVAAGCGFSTTAGGNPPAGTDGNSTPPVDGSTMQPDDGAPATMPVVRIVTIGANKVTNGPHVDFPMLVTAAITSAHPMGFDIYFSTDQAGTQKLAHEIERYQTNALVAWVKVPSLSQATQIYLHYGDTSITTSQENKAAVWTASFAAVWHLQDLTDATNQNNGTNTGTTAVAAGKIAGTRSFNANGNVIAAGSDASVDDVFAGGGTAEAWFYATSWGQSGLGRIFDKGPSTTVFSMGDGNVNSSVLFGHTFTSQSGNWTTPQNSVQVNMWTHVAVTYNSDAAGNVPTIYINGTAQTLSGGGSQGNATTDANGTMTIGDRSNGSRAFGGMLDELRLSTTTRSAGWITTSYANQLDAAAFAVVGPPL